jgi:hypothetical protein
MRSPQQHPLRRTRPLRQPLRAVGKAVEWEHRVRTRTRARLKLSARNVSLSLGRRRRRPRASAKSLAVHRSPQLRVAMLRPPLRLLPQLPLQQRALRCRPNAKQSAKPSASPHVRP